MRWLGGCLWLFLAWPAFAGTGVALDAAERDRRLAILYATEPRTPFCGTPYRIAGEKPTLRAGVPVVWAPIVPLAQLLGGRSAKDEPELVQDLYNWAPLDQSFVARRGEARLGPEVESGETVCGGLLARGAAYLPPPAMRGDVARLLFYFERAHGVALDDATRARLVSWDVADPVDEAEAARVRAIDVVQGTEFGVPVRTLDGLVRQARQSVARDPWTSDLDSVERHLRDGSVSLAYFRLDMLLQRRLEHIALQAYEGSGGAWDEAFESLVVHDSALRIARPGVVVVFDGVAAKMFALAVASGDDERARRYAEWLRRFVPTGVAHRDNAYAAWIVQMADIVERRRWPSPGELRAELGPYRGLFLPAADVRGWRDAVTVAAAAYLSDRDVLSREPLILPVEFAALQTLRRQHAVSTPALPVHALQTLPTAQVPRFRPGAQTRALQQVRRGFERVPPPPPLHRAILANDDAAFRAALSAGNVNRTDSTGATPLRLAAEWGRGAMLKSLRAAGARWRPEDQSLLSVAAHGGLRETVEMMLAAGADPNDSGSQEESPLEEALKSQRETLAMVEALLRAGARPGQRASEVGHELARVPDPQLFERLLAALRGAGLDPAGSRLMCGLVIYQPPGAPQFAIARRQGATLDDGAERGLAPIFCAIERRELRMVEWLVGAGARLNVRDEQDLSPAEAAEDVGATLIAEYLRAAQSRPR